MVFEDGKRLPILVIVVDVVYLIQHGSAKLLATLVIAPNQRQVFVRNQSSGRVCLPGDFTDLIRNKHLRLVYKQ